MFSFHAEVFVRIRAIKGANAPIPFRGASKEKNLCYIDFDLTF